MIVLVESSHAILERRHELFTLVWRLLPPVQCGEVFKYNTTVTTRDRVLQTTVSTRVSTRVSTTVRSKGSVLQAVLEVQYSITVNTRGTHDNTRVRTRGTNDSPRVNTGAKDRFRADTSIMERYTMRRSGERVVQRR